MEIMLICCYFLLVNLLILGAIMSVLIFVIINNIIFVCPKLILWLVCRWNGGRSTKLEGSDHIPVYVRLTDIPDLPVHSTPALSIRYVPEVRGWQQSIGMSHCSCFSFACISVIANYLYKRRIGFWLSTCQKKYRAFLWMCFGKKLG